MATLKATKIGSRFISNTISQDALDGDWVYHEVVTKYKLPEITLDGTSTSTSLDTFDVVAENDKVKLYDGVSVVDGSLGTTTTTTTTTTNSLTVGTATAIATYKLDGDATDLSGTYNGTATSVTYDTGKFGQAGVFNGSSSYISTGIPASLTAYTNNFSFSAWINVSSKAILYQTLFSTFTGATPNYLGYNIAFNFSANTIGFGYIDDGGITGSYPITITLSTWYHVVVSVVGTTSTLYVNGTNVSSYTNSSGGAATSTAYIGTTARGVGTQIFHGLIDQVRIFNRALTAIEVEALYNEKNAKYTADITSFGLSTPPTKAYFNKTIDTTLSAEATGSANSTAIIGLIINSATSTTANITLASGTMTTSNSVVLNGKQFTPLTAVLDTGTTYDITFDDIGFTPDEGYIFLSGSTDIVPTVASDTFDGVDTFTKTYNTVTKTARDVEYGFVGDTDVEVVQVNINQNMEP